SGAALEPIFLHTIHYLLLDLPRARYAVECELGGLAGRLDNDVSVVEQMGDRAADLVRNVCDARDKRLLRPLAQAERQALNIVNALTVQSIQVVSPILPII